MYQPFHLNYDRDGILLLAATITKGAILPGSVEMAITIDRPTPLDAAVDWATMCGEDPYVVAPSLVARVREVEADMGKVL